MPKRGPRSVRNSRVPTRNCTPRSSSREELFAHPADRERFITRVREAIADEIERGEPLSAPRVRTRTKDLSQYPPRTPDRAQERVLS